MYKHINAEVDIDDNAASILPRDDYTYLLGASLFVFDRINAFVVENLGYTGLTGEYDWYHLIDARQLSYVKLIREHIDQELNTNIADQFDQLLNERNRIVHGLPVTIGKKEDDNREQVMDTKTKHNDKNPANRNKQHIITREEMQKFIADCMDLNNQLIPVRKQLRDKNKA